MTATNIHFTDIEGRPVKRKLTKITWDASAGGKERIPALHAEGDSRTAADDSRHDARALLLRYRRGGSAGYRIDPERVCRSRTDLARCLWHLVARGARWEVSAGGDGCTPVQVDIASEFRYRDPLVGKDDLFITISQSGETADTLAAAREAKEKGARIVSIVNVVGSTLARESDGVLYTHCGPEISVASTKAFTAQLTALYMLALHLGRVRGTLSVADGKAWLDRLVRLPALVEWVLGRETEIVAIAKRYYKKRNFLFFGRGINYPIALEGALKLKEVSYIHAEGYAAGEMKHGPIALIDRDMPVVVLAPRDRLYEKTVSNLMEVKARRAPVIAFVAEGERELGKIADAVFTIPDTHPLLSPILFTIPLQFLAYHIAVMRGADVDGDAA